MNRILALLAAFATAAPAAAAERTYSVTDFERVVVEGPYVVRLVTGRASSARAEGNQASLDRLSLDVSGQTLRIRRNRNHWGGNDGAQQGVVRIDLVTRNIRSARVIGPGSLELETVEGLRVDLSLEGSGRLAVARVAADNLSVGLAGSGQIELAGAAESLVADVQGSGDLDAAALGVEQARVTTTTTGTVALEVSEEAEVNALGLGTVTIIGSPSCRVRGPAADLVSCGR